MFPDHADEFAAFSDCGTGASLLAGGPRLFLPIQSYIVQTRHHTILVDTCCGPDKDIPAPDVGTDGQHMAWMMDTYSQEMGFAIPGVVTGKSGQKPISLKSCQAITDTSRSCRCHRSACERPLP
jgi:hypothetical protein